MLRDIGLTPFAKVSGSRGIHVVAPLSGCGRRTRSGAARGALAERIAAEQPDTLTTEWRKDKRDGRILVDVARNTYGQTIVAAYAVRGAPGRAGLGAGHVGRGRRPRAHAAGRSRCATWARLATVGDVWADIDEHAGTLPKDSTMS